MIVISRAKQVLPSCELATLKQGPNTILKLSGDNTLCCQIQCFKKHGRAREKPQSRAWRRHSLEYGGWHSHGAAVTNTHDWLAGLPKSHRCYVGVVLSDNPEVILTIVIRDNIRSSSTTFRVF